MKGEMEDRIEQSANLCSAPPELERAQTKIRNGAIAGVFYVVVMPLVHLAPLLKGASAVATPFNDPAEFTELCIGCLLAYGVWRRSRMAAIGLMAYYLLTTLLAWSSGNRPDALMFALACLVFWIFFSAVRGCFAYHRIQRALNPSYRAFRRWTLIFWIPAAVVGVLLLLAAIIGTIAPPNEVLGGKSLRPDHARFLRTSGIVKPDEKIVLFCSTGFLSIEEKGCLLTPTRLVSYETCDGRLNIQETSLTAIRDVQMEEKGGVLSETILRVTKRDGESFSICVFSQNKGDERFMQELDKGRAAAREGRLAAAMSEQTFAPSVDAKKPGGQSPQIAPNPPTSDQSPPRPERTPFNLPFTMALLIGGAAIYISISISKDYRDTQQDNVAGGLILLFVVGMIAAPKLVSTFAGDSIVYRHVTMGITSVIWAALFGLDAWGLARRGLPAPTLVVVIGCQIISLAGILVMFAQDLYPVTILPWL